MQEICSSLNDTAAEGAAAALRLPAIESTGVSSTSTSDTADSDGKEAETPTGPKRRRIDDDSGRVPSADGTPESTSAHSPVRVFVYWGYAGWSAPLKRLKGLFCCSRNVTGIQVSRCQLMGEIARGSWGLCKANTQDVVSKRPDEVWQAVYPRLVFAPKSDPCENYSGESPQEERRQQLRRMAIIHDLLTGRHASARDEDEEAEAEDPEEERAALAEELEAADASESAEEAEDRAWLKRSAPWRVQCGKRCVGARSDVWAEWKPGFREATETLGCAREMGLLSVSSAPGTTGATRAFMGFLAALGACFASGFGGVFMEMVLKGSATSIWLRNAQLAIFGASTAAWVVFQEGHEAPLVHGYTFWVWLMAFTVASGGMLVAAVLKYADNILRQFSTAISVILTTALSALVLEDITLDMMFAAGTVLTIGATFMYSGMLDDFLPKWMQ
eukprot:g31257.t1